MNTAIFISARTSSTRLPNKVILDICGTTAIEHLVNNLKKSRYCDNIVLCTTINDNDLILCNKAEELNINYYRGNEEDKLLRWLGACCEFDVDVFVECGADDMCCDYKFIDCFFEKFFEEECDFIDGKGWYNDVYCMTHNCLRKVCKLKNEIIETHDLSNFMGSVFNTKKIIADQKYKSKYRLTLDYEEDLKLFQKIITDIGTNFTYDELLSYLDKNPKVSLINQHMEKQWRENQK